MGNVYLVGGGPGDKGLFTVKGQELIRKADCIVYDRLVNPELLADAAEDCELIYVGKENKHHTMKQEDINALLVEKAKQHTCVVRLKGGDVYVFGRGGEEGLYLREHGVPFEVVPGISSSIAGLAYAGIPITHRGIATGFHVVSAHNRHDEVSDIDFDAMAHSDDTCVFLMGLTKLKEIVTGLLNAGKAKDCPVAVIANATLPTQKTLVSTLDQIVTDLEVNPLPSPALIVVGKVVSLRKELNFFEEQPLFSKRFVIPRVGAEKSRLAESLRTLGADPVEVQVSRFIEHKEALDTITCSAYDIIVLSSRNAVNFFMNSLRKNNIDLRTFAHTKFAVVGEASKQELATYGIYADYCPHYFTGNELCELLMGEVEETTRILIPKAAGDDANWIPLMDKAQVTIIDLYETVKVEEPFSGISIEEADAIIFTCSSSVKYTLRETNLPDDIQIYSIGEKTSQTLREHGITNFEQASQASYAGLLACILEKGAH